MREKYLRIMEHALNAYSKKHIQEYLEAVRTDGLKEHGFPRLTANIGLLLAERKRIELLSLFCEMMDLCCEQIPGRQAANDFSVKEICFAILALEKTNIVNPEKLNNWKEHLRGFDPWKDYNCIAPAPDVRVGNWAAYSAASEYLRQVLGLCDASGFLNRQIPAQLLSLDENGMYRDPNEPVLYDLATRAQFAILLHFGYEGPCRTALDDCLRKSGLLTLRMQSVTGEMAFGGRSNQYLFNEAYLAAVCAYEAVRYAGEGNLILAGQFQDAAELAADSILAWLDRLDGKRHIKNMYPIDSSYGCEGYGYFDKYMISLASFIYLAVLFTDDTIQPVPCPARTGGFTASTSHYFHKYFASSGGYFLEWDIDADPHYDASGLGRIHKAGAPSELMLSVPFAEKPVYTIKDSEGVPWHKYIYPDRNPGQLAMCGGILSADRWHFSSESGAIRSIHTFSESADCVEVELLNALGQTERYKISPDGVHITLTGQGSIAYALPLFVFNGNSSSFIVFSEGSQEAVVDYQRWLYCIETDGILTETDQLYRNRNGTYRLFTVSGTDTLHIHLSCKRNNKG